MGIFSRFHRVPPFFVGTLCGGCLYVYYYQNLQLKYHIMPQTIWDITYPRNNNRNSNIISDEKVNIGLTQNQLYDKAFNKRKNREMYRDYFIIGWNDSVRSLHSFLIRNIFGEELQ